MRIEWFAESDQLFDEQILQRHGVYGEPVVDVGRAGGIEHMGQGAWSLKM